MDMSFVGIGIIDRRFLWFCIMDGGSEHKLVLLNGILMIALVSSVIEL